MRAFLLPLCTGFSLVLAGGCATSPATTAGDGPGRGYFLSLSQKGQLIGTGTIRDKAGNVYDVHVVPGYVDPAQRMSKYAARSGHCFAEYGSKRKYQDLAHDSHDALRWAWHGCVVSFIFEKLPQDWREIFQKAANCTERRAFGWWFAYPWATMVATLDTAVRVPVGLTGAAIGTVGGAGAVPAWHLANSAVEGTGEFALCAVAAPAVGWTWNTLIAPPMALVGQKPAPARVDGFWVTMKTPQQGKHAEQANQPPTEADIGALAQWGQALLPEVDSADKRRQDERRACEAAVQAAKQVCQEAVQAAQARQQTNLALIEREERACVAAAARVLTNHVALESLRAQGYDHDRTAAAVATVRARLMASGMPAADAGRVQAALLRFDAASLANAPAAGPIAGKQGEADGVPGKTDPLRESAHLIQQMGR